MIYREANRGDIPKLLELEQAVIEYERPFNSDLKAKDAVYYDLPQRISSTDSLLLLVEDTHQIIASGYADVRASKESLTHDKHVYLGFMYVSPEHRGQGLNKDLMQHLIEWGQDRQISHFYLDVYAENESAISAYRKSGFLPCTLEMKLCL